MRAIIYFIKAEATKFDTLTAEAQCAIDQLQERRTALISAAVTGQNDVRTLPKRSRMAFRHPKAILRARRRRAEAGRKSAPSPRGLLGTGAVGDYCSEITYESVDLITEPRFYVDFRHPRLIKMQPRISKGAKHAQ